MKKFDFTIEQLIDTVRQLAKQYPTARYKRPKKAHNSLSTTATPGCSYAYGCAIDGPKAGRGCIFGQALQLLGVSRRLCRTMEGKARMIGIDSILARRMEPTPSARKINWCAMVQSRQDSGNVWIDCILAADKRYPL